MGIEIEVTKACRCNEKIRYSDRLLFGVICILQKLPVAVSVGIILIGIYLLRSLKRLPVQKAVRLLQKFLLLLKSCFAR